MDGECQLSFKVILCGSSGVGKTSLVGYYLEGALDTEVSSTVQPAYTSTEIETHGQKVCLQLWDTAGQEKYQDLMKQYYRDARCAVLCFTLETFDSIDLWLERIREGAGADCQVILTVTKEDLLTRDEAHDIFNKAYKYVEDKRVAAVAVTSAQTGNGVNELFQMVANTCWEHHVNMPDPEVIDVKKQKQGQKTGCCG